MSIYLAAWWLISLTSVFVFFVCSLLCVIVAGVFAEIVMSFQISLPSAFYIIFASESIFFLTIILFAFLEAASCAVFSV